MSLVRALDGPKGIIAVNSAIRESTRKRFTIAHEIGHYLIPHHRSLRNVCRSDDIERWHSSIASAEREANEFSAELLLPRKLVSRSLGLKNPSPHTIRAVAGEFSMSLTATIYRFLELTDLACCMIWSEGGRAKWYVRSEAFRLPLPMPDLPRKRGGSGLIATKPQPIRQRIGGTATGVSQSVLAALSAPNRELTELDVIARDIESNGLGSPKSCCI
jgi:hypothetical protein